MKRLCATLLLDMKLQARSQLYTIGIAMAVLMGLLVRFLIPTTHIGRGLAGFYLLGLGSTTFMFGSSMLLLEKGEHTLEAMRVTMMTSTDYILSKAITLTGFAIIESAIVYIIAVRGMWGNLLFLGLGTATLGVFYTVVGLGLAAAHDAITRFLLPTGVLLAMILQLPVFSLFDVGPAWLWYIIPTQAPLLILQGSFELLATWQWIYAGIMSVVMCAGSWWFCTQRFRAHVGLQEA